MLYVERTENGKIVALHSSPHPHAGEQKSVMDEEILDRCADAAWEAFVSSGVRATIAQAEGIA